MRVRYFKIVFSVALFISTCFASKAQELNFKVTVNAPPTKSVDAKVYAALQQALQELINTTKWTDDVFEQNETLTGSMSLNVKTESSVTDFIGDLTLQFNRPVFGSDQLTPLLVHLDRDIAFHYEQFQPMQYAANTFNDNLIHTLAYFAYVALALDYDSFSLNGGDAFWQKAQDLVNVVPSGGQESWKGKSTGSTARGAFVENALNPRMKSYRPAIYDYHRMGIDYASSNMPRCREGILKALAEIDEAHQSIPGTLTIRAFASTKSDEMIEIFKNAPSDQKTKFLQIMTKIDPTNVNKYSSVGF